jgi:hypothetical protein
VACERIREGAARATRRVEDVAPSDRIDPSYSLEIRYVDPFDDDDLPDRFFAPELLTCSPALFSQP